MSPKLRELLNKVKGYVMSKEEKDEQAISFVHGQLMDCAPHITKEEVRKQLKG
jgi:hypothetical protein